MKRVMQLAVVFAAVGLMNGCTKCSQEQPAEVPPAVTDPATPDEGAAPADEAAPAEGTATEGDAATTEGAGQ